MFHFTTYQDDRLIRYELRYNGQIVCTEYYYKDFSGGGSLLRNILASEPLHVRAEAEVGRYQLKDAMRMWLLTYRRRKTA